MRSVFDFIVKPIGGRYNNDIEVGDYKLTLNSSIEDFKFINNVAEVISVPTAFNTVIEPGDTIMIHHNVFRRYYNQKGEAVDSSKLFKENLYFCQPDQVYLYKKDNEWKPIGKRCFVMPIESKETFSLAKEKKDIGILKISNSSLEALGVAQGDLVGFKSNREFEFIVDNQRLYCMESNDILLKYDKQGDEVEYNPSWAKSS